VYLHGPPGVGKRELARGACGLLNCPLLYLDLEQLLARESEAEQMLRLVFREGLLFQGALYLDCLDCLLGEASKAKALLQAIAGMMAEWGWLLFLAGEKSWYGGELFEPMAFQAIALPLPDVQLREAIWKDTLTSRFPNVSEGWVRQLANQFRLTLRQIRAAVAMVGEQYALRGERADLDLADLYAACRCQSNRKLGELALKIEPHYGWQDLILPADKLAQLQEICSHARHRQRVFGDWGFDRKLSHGKGLSALFSGPPGTGKTMAAEVIARDLQVDLYKIDLSGVVSKYIGETEKNLSRIFREAETSNAILFFDEADALFGKRTEVSDAHDRYANIETSYLLQKMEEYEGIVILATNLRENMDEAFTRRLRFIVEFPFPDEANRLFIWKNHFPSEAPLSEAIDYQFLARKFPIAGGNIKNIVLSAAFYAAEDGGKIEMEHILRGTRREFEKVGKLWAEVRLPGSSAR
jgi:AAA+ superfamily predicted ATPase